MNIKRHVTLKLDEEDFNVLDELAAEKRLPVSTYARTIIIASQEFKNKNENKKVE